MLSIILPFSQALPEVNKEPVPTEFIAYPSMLNVDLATGDPSVSIPLLTVPGRGGLDYPVILNYAPGIGLEQTAGWVGLGWSISVPAVSREVLGVPDDHSCYNIVFHEHYPVNEGNWFQRALRRVFVVFHNFFMFIETTARGDFSGKRYAGFHPTFKVSTDGLELEYNTDNYRQLNGRFRSGVSGVPCPGDYEEDDYDYNSTDIYMFNQRGKMFGGTNGFRFLHTSRFSAGYDMNVQTNNQGRITSFTYPSPSGTRIVMDKTVSKANYVSKSGYIMSEDDYRPCTDDHYSQTSKSGSFITSWKATKILSQDYVDSNNNGVPDNSDAGNWVRFNYVDTYVLGNPYKERTPHQSLAGQNNCQISGEGVSRYISYDTDVSTLSTIETPTHIAYFISDTTRYDTRDSNLNANLVKKLPRLTRIELRLRADNSLVKRIDLVYDDSLVLNAPDSSTNHGRLTLKEIRSFDANNIESIAPYRFVYNENNPSYNPSYNINKFDRWGNYYANGAELEHNRYGNPQGLIPQAWSLTDITWPSGGSSHIKYESDSYTKINHWFPEYGGQSANRYGGGVRAKWIQHCDGYSNCYGTRYLYNTFPYVSSGTPGNVFAEGTSSGSISYDMPYYSRDRPNFFIFGNPYMSNTVLYEKVGVVSNFDPDASYFKSKGFSINEFYTPSNNPNPGKNFGIDIYGNLQEELEFCQYLNGGDPENGNTYDGNIRFGFCGANGYPMIPRGGRHIFVGKPHHTYYFGILTQSGFVELETFSLGPSGTLVTNNICANHENCAYNVPGNPGSPGNPQYEILEYELNGDNDLEYHGVHQRVTPVDHLPNCLSERSHYEGNANHNEYCDELEISLTYNGLAHHGDMLENEASYGALKSTKNYDANQQLVSKTENTYAFVGDPGYTYQSYDGDFEGMQVRFKTFMLTSTTNTGVNGFSNTVNYGNRNTQSQMSQRTINGLPRREEVIGSYPKKRITETYYAYELYPGYPNLQEAALVIVGNETTVFNSNLSLIQNAKSISQTVYANFGNNVNPIWRPSEQRVWLDNDLDGRVDSGEMKLTIQYLSYDSFGNLLQARDARGFNSNYFYGDSGMCTNTGNTLYHAALTCFRDAQGKESKMFYDKNFQVHHFEDANRIGASFLYDNNNRLVSMTGVGVYNYVANSGFETDSGENSLADHWTAAGLNSYSLEDEGYLGRAQRIIPGTGSWPQIRSDKFFGIVPGEHYVVSAMVKSPAGSGNLGLAFHGYSGGINDESYDQNIGTSVVRDGQWRRVTFDFVAGNNIDNGRVMLYFTQGSQGYAVIDNVQLERGTVPSSYNGELIMYKYNYGINDDCSTLDFSDEECMNWVQTTSLVDEDTVSRSRAYVDGLGRSIQSSTQKDDNHAIVINKYYNERGLLDHISQPREVTISWLYGILPVPSKEKDATGIRSWFNSWGGLSKNTEDEILAYKEGYS